MTDKKKSETAKVRLTINGWPSLQFVGCPSIAVGTFAGRVSVIDAIEDGRHYSRVIVTPDTKSIAAGKDKPWSSVKFLRPGAQTTGWIRLKQLRSATITFSTYPATLFEG